MPGMFEALLLGQPAAVESMRSHTLGDRKGHHAGPGDHEEDLKQINRYAR
jgi:hypothetical protein